MKKYRRAEESQRRYGNPALFAQSSTLLFWSALEEASNTNFDLDAFPIKAKDVTEAIWLLENKLLNWDGGRIRQAVVDARALVFDAKYGDLQKDDDERHSLGIDAWTEEFETLLTVSGAPVTRAWDSSREATC
ncbi:hypothetical protein ACG74X_19035 [Marivita sp. S0852]|uniref:hypothetical protein n=1 Tax=Marivita sp. S0852 TaxID=3373893 RepID=UPI003982B8C5